MQLQTILDNFPKLPNANPRAEFITDFMKCNLVSNVNLCQPVVHYVELLDKLVANQVFDLFQVELC